MAKARAALQAEIERQNGVNRANCDYLLHALQKVGFQEEDVDPLRKYELTPTIAHCEQSRA